MITTSKKLSFDVRGCSFLAPSHVKESFIKEKKRNPFSFDVNKGTSKGTLGGIDWDLLYRDPTYNFFIELILTKYGFYFFLDKTFLRERSELPSNVKKVYLVGKKLFSCRQIHNGSAYEGEINFNSSKVILSVLCESVFR